MRNLGMIRRVLTRLRRRQRGGRDAKRVDLPGGEVIQLLVWLLVGVAFVWAVFSSLGKDGPADALLPVMFAVILVMINQVVSWQRDRERKRHEERMEEMVAEIRKELRKTNSHMARIKPSDRRTA